MERYAPRAKDLAGRDVVARAIQQEIMSGRGCGAQADHVLLRIGHLGEDIIRSRLPGIRELAMRFAGVDPVAAPIPVVPTAHYMMGGIPTNLHGQVVAPARFGPEEPVPGLYAVGECACVSVHGANRLGGNSLLDLVVFGREAGNHMLEYLRDNPFPRKLPDNSAEVALDRLGRWDRVGEGVKVADVRESLQDIMQRHCGVYRTQALLEEGLRALDALRPRLDAAVLADTSRVFNTARIEALELENLYLVGRASVVSALARTESRGAHAREDHPERDDDAWLRHTLYHLDGDQLDYKPVRLKPLTVDSFHPKQRVY
jgi:succinate dehydrogenase / fumarate reductase flavoprotein subunit